MTTSTFGRGRLSFASAADIDEFADALARYERGELSADDWRVFRLVRGTYGQRQDNDASMVRIKVPQGRLSAEGMRAIADAADAHSRGFAHITTRQNVQMHFVPLHDVEAVMRRMAAAGLTTREACGHSVRTITACPLAGVSPSEVFDPTPYADALTRFLLRHPLASRLPRKFKIAFEGCAEDHARTAIHDIGLRAVRRDGRRGFRVSVGGGTAILCRSAAVLFEFLPAAHLLDAAQAILEVFQRRGDYQHRQRNRLKFLIRQLGWDQFRAEVLDAFEVLRRHSPHTLPFGPDAPPEEQAPDWPRPSPPEPEQIAALVTASAPHGFGLLPQVSPVLQPSAAALAAWTVTNVGPQRQNGYSVVTISAPLGDITSAQWRVLASLAESYADGTARLTIAQDVVLRWVSTANVADLYRRLAAAGLGEGGAGTAAAVTSCPGAETCRLAVTQSRGLAADLRDSFHGRPELLALGTGVDVKVSGCPNGCGQHHIAAVGFQGSLRKVEGRAVPQYFVMVGGGIGADGAQFGRVVAKVPARRARVALERLLECYHQERRPDESAPAYFQRADTARLRALLHDLETLTVESASADDFIDLGDASTFAPVLLDGECSV